MSTRALTHIKDSTGEIILTFYTHCDGYPTGHGKDLAEFLNGFKIVSGLGGDSGKIANGMECLAAQIIANFKKEPGHTYIYKAGAKDCGEEYVYEISVKGESILKLEGFDAHRSGKKGVCVFTGSPAGVLEQIAKLKE